MFSKQILIKLAFYVLVLSSIAVAQPPPPVQKATAAPTRAVELPSLREVTETSRFSSTEWLFSIGLPKDISGYGAIAPNDTPANVAGDYYQWRLREGVVVITCLNYLDQTFSLTTEKQYSDFFKGVTDGAMAKVHGTLVSGARVERDGGMNGFKYLFQMPNGAAGIGRVYYKNKQSYSMIAVASKDLGGSELMLTMALDSFSLIPKTKVDKDIRKSIEASTPTALPQKPVTKKERTDAEDGNLKGKVKTVTSESEDISGTGSVQGKHLNSIDDYNDQGNLIKILSYDYRGNPSDITEYGYIDNARVSTSKFIRYEYDPPPPAAPPVAAGPQKVRDKRVGSRYEYKYANGKLSEKQMYSNDGSLWLRYVFNYDGDTIEKIVYDEKGKLNQRFLTKVDSKGNEIETTAFDVFSPQIYGDRKYTTTYETFDDHGNWTKSITAKLVKENGKEIYKPWYISYRTISYY